MDALLLNLDVYELITIAIGIGMAVLTVAYIIMGIRDIPKAKS